MSGVTTHNRKLSIIIVIVILYFSLDTNAYSFTVFSTWTMDKTMWQMMLNAVFIYRSTFILNE